MSKLKKLAKTKKFWWIVAGLVVISIAYGVGNSSAQIELEEGNVRLDDLNSRIVDATNELYGVQEKVEETEQLLQEEESRLSDKKSEVDEVLALIDDRDSLTNDINDKKSELESLNSDIEEKQSELELLNGQIVEAAGKPIEILSGQYFVGVDIPEGRYQASGTSNFVVYGSDGSLKVNTILGDAYGDGDYVFFALEGDYIEASSKTTLTPVE